MQDGGIGLGGGAAGEDLDLGGEAMDSTADGSDKTIHHSQVGGAHFITISQRPISKELVCSVPFRAFFGLRCSACSTLWVSFGEEREKVWSGG
jgi:hypothetical protein